VIKESYKNKEKIRMNEIDEIYGRIKWEYMR
jgi:hypothetical protein